MNYNIYFSPTGSTQRAVCRMGAVFGEAKHVDLSAEMADLTLHQQDFCVVGVPSFGGRVPDFAARQLRYIRGTHTPALILVTYGCRAYEDTLLEVKDILNEQGFICVGAAALVTEHSIVRSIGAGRPDAEDFDRMEAFAVEVKRRLQHGVEEIEVPGSRPYKERHVAAMPILVSEDCVNCGACAAACPTHAIHPIHPQETEQARCIGCMRCVSVCPVQARVCEPEALKRLSDRLGGICQSDKPNEFF